MGCWGSLKDLSTDVNFTTEFRVHFSVCNLSSIKRRGLTVALACDSHLTDMVKWGSMTENSSAQIDDLFTQIRLRLALVRQSDPATADELKGLVIQLEDWVESLVVDSLKLKSLESRPKRATKSQNARRKRPGRK